MRKFKFYVFLSSNSYLHSYVFFTNIPKILFVQFKFKICAKPLHIFPHIRLTLTMKSTVFP
jgi:hypothetical protein